MSNLVRETVEATKQAVLADPSFVPEIVSRFGLPTMEDINAEQLARQQQEQGQEDRLADLETGLQNANSTQNQTNATFSTALETKAPLNSPSFTGSPTVPNVTAGDSSTRAANTAFVAAAMAALINSSPGALDTLKELADAIGDDPNFAATMTAALGGKASKNANLSDLANVVTARTNLGLSTVAATGAYNDLGGKPNLSSVATSGLFSDLSGVPDAATTAKGVTWFAGDGATTAGRAVQATDGRLSNSRTPIGTAGGDLTGTYPNPTLAPITVSDATAPSTDSGTLTGLLSGLAAMVKAITGKTSWRTAPTTTLEAAATHATNTNNPHSTTAAQVGLGNVNNTSDANKPVSTATQAALDKKESKIQKIRVQTAADGTYTWTFATPFGSGVIPNIKCDVEAPSGATVRYSIQMQGPPTNTSVAVKVVKDNPTLVSLVGLTLLGVPSAPGATYIHLTAQDPT